MTDAVIPGGRLGWEWPARPFGALADCFAAEGDRRLLWLPVFFGAGIGVYFDLTVEPPLWPGIVAAIAGIGLALQLPFCFEVRALSDRLVSSTPE
jgi:hypothetical protein